MSTQVGLAVVGVVFGGEVGGWGRDPFSRNFMKPTPRRKWYLTTGRSFHEMVLDHIPQSLPVHFFGSRPQPPTSRSGTIALWVCAASAARSHCVLLLLLAVTGDFRVCVCVCVCVCERERVCLFVCLCVC